MSLLKKIAGKILSKKKTPEEVQTDIKNLDPKAQWWASITRPIISISLVYVLIIGVFIQWIQQMCNTPDIYLITIPKYLLNFAKIIVTVHVGTRGVQNIVKQIINKI